MAALAGLDFAGNGARRYEDIGGGGEPIGLMVMWSQKAEISAESAGERKEWEGERTVGGRRKREVEKKNKPEQCAGMGRQGARSKKPEIRQQMTETEREWRQGSELLRMAGCRRCKAERRRRKVQDAGGEWGTRKQIERRGGGQRRRSNQVRVSDGDRQQRRQSYNYYNSTPGRISLKNVALLKRRRKLYVPSKWVS